MNQEDMLTMVGHSNNLKANRRRGKVIIKGIKSMDIIGMSSTSGKKGSLIRKGKQAINSIIGTFNKNN